MKNLLATTALALLASGAYAQEAPNPPSNPQDQITADLEAQGFTVSDTRSFFGRTRVETTRAGVEVEFVFRNATQELLDIRVDEDSLPDGDPTPELFELIEDLGDLADFGGGEDGEDLIEDLEDLLEELEDALEEEDEEE